FLRAERRRAGDGARALLGAARRDRPRPGRAVARPRRGDLSRDARAHAPDRLRPVRRRVLPTDGRAASGHGAVDAAGTHAAAAATPRVEERPGSPGRYERQGGLPLPADLLEQAAHAREGARELALREPFL